MTVSPAIVLIVEDVAALAETYASYLANERCTVERAGSAAAARAAIDRRVPEVMLLDVMLPDGSGMDILRDVRTRDLPTDVVVMTSEGSVGLAVEAMKHGAIDFLTKPFSADRLRVTVRNALMRRRLESQIAAIQDEVEREEFCGFVGQSMTMQSVYRIMQNAAASTAPVLLKGERGTGKALCAHALHRMSRRRDRPYLALDCAALAPDRLEVELFGRWARAATMDREGALLKANGGTIFLDEVFALGPTAQARLLRYLHTGSLKRIDEHQLRRTDVRLICATERDPQAEIAAGRFSEELFYKLDILSIELPPLRERDDDVLRLASHFLPRLGMEERKRFTGFSPEAEAAMLAYDWPGNVQELQNVLRGLVILNEGGTVEASMLPPTLAVHAPRPASSAGADVEPLAPHEPAVIEPLERVMRRTIEEAIAKCSGNIPRAAVALQVTPASLYRRLQSWQAQNATPASR
ncbi:regulatory protein, Fis family [Enhydrobacter aerosaccus]|uniref:Regulatory protein, Fis family n=1 Tax=Enhydrobacter aerosaccus TaxID=225324 RepID=A0A1T4PG31_9HYPH|nr:sigma-54 dependent transcriptional regulator [Enhydrobacter aerosaccus]SJZ90530.1 regulatory protein, Fis family [Enhydrobacter aerosaccus]